MAEEKTCKCPQCGCTFTPSEEQGASNGGGQKVDTSPTSDEDQGFGEETKLAVLIALVPAMTMTVFNLMGLI